MDCQMMLTYSHSIWDVCLDCLKKNVCEEIYCWKYFFQGCSVAVNPGAKKQREQLAGFPLLCVPQHYSCQMTENAGNK